MSERTWCWPLLHRWTKWSDPVVVRGKVTYNPQHPSLAKTYDHQWLKQTRDCQRCNLHQERTINA